MSTKEKAAETDEATAKGGKKKLLLIVLVLLLAAGGAAYFFLFSGSAKAAAPVSSGTFLTLDPVAVNLAGGGYLKIGVALELTEDGAAGGEGGGLDGSKATDLSSPRSRRPRRPTSPVPGTPSRRPCSRRSSRPTPRTATNGHGHLLHRVRHPVVEGPRPRGSPVDATAVARRTTRHTLPDDRRRPGAAGQGRSRFPPMRWNVTEPATGPAPAEPDPQSPAESPAPPAAELPPRRPPPAPGRCRPRRPGAAVAASRDRPQPPRRAAHLRLPPADEALP